MAAQLPGRIIDSQPSIEKVFRRVVDWIANYEGHPDCHGASHILPTRVIDVGGGQDNRPIRLVEPSSGTHERYIALSHSWGRTELPITTKANKAQRLEAIGLKEMSKSFEEAIVVTRLLGVLYICIDSLCICQDDPEDWETEAAKMGSVNSNAFLTISITGAKDSSEGCFAHRVPREYAQINYTDKSGTQEIVSASALPIEREYDANKYVELDTEPLSGRGWYFQERVLSRRILHCASDQVYFECMQDFRSEDGLFLPNRYFSVHGPQRIFTFLVQATRTLIPTSSNGMRCYGVMALELSPRALISCPRWVALLKYMPTS